jgi:predicted NBD/HSP70 family sugar kinase
LASGWAILQAVQQLPGYSDVITLDAVETKFCADDAVVKEIVSRAGHSLGIAIGSLVGTLHIKKIILTGEVARFGQPWLDAVHGALSGAALGRMTQEAQLEFGKLDYRACILGASAYLLLNDYSLLFQQEK